MLGFIIKKVIGSKNDREVKKLRPLVQKINEIEASLQSLPDDALRKRPLTGRRDFLKSPITRSLRTDSTRFFLKLLPW